MTTGTQLPTRKVGLDHSFECGLDCVTDRLAGDVVDAFIMPVAPHAAVIPGKYYYTGTDTDHTLQPSTIANHFTCRLYADNKPSELQLGCDSGYQG